MSIIQFIVLVFNSAIKDKDFAFEEARYIYFSDKRADSVQKRIVFSETELLDETSREILFMIGDHNDSMVGLDEDDIIYSNEVKRNCLMDIKAFCDKNTCSSKMMELTELLAWAIDHDKNVYFLTDYVDSK